MHKGMRGGRQGMPRRRRREDIDIKELKQLNKGDLRFLLPYLKNHRWSIVFSIVWTILNSAAGILPPLVIKILVDETIISEQGERNTVILYSIYLGLLYICTFFLNFKRSRITTITAQKIILEMREDIYTKILTQPMEYHERHKRGELLSVVINDVNALTQAITTGIINLFNDILSIIGIFIAMIALDRPLAILICLFIPIIVFTARKFRRRMKKTFHRLRKKLAQMNASVEENVSGIRVAQSLAVESKNVRKFGELTEQNYNLRMKSVTLFSKMSFIISLNTYIVIALVLGIGGTRYINQGMTLGVLLAFLQYVPKFLGPVSDLGNLSNTFIEAGAALLHIREYLTDPTGALEPENPKSLPEVVKGDILFKDVAFSYTDAPLIEELNLAIKAKERIGIVGETGAGKTTLIKLIARLYDIRQGTIFIDGIDIFDLTLKDLRSLMALVSQDAYIFSDTIGNNIRFGRPDATLEEVRKAARLAQAQDFIEKLPLQYDTKLGEQGVGISGGQKQLLAYARMILARPKIAILDEATSNIDSYTENIIRENLKYTLEDCTTIIIAHRFATLQTVNRIVVLDQGTIQDIGTHAELMERSSYYHQLYTQQYSKM